MNISKIFVEREVTENTLVATISAGLDIPVQIIDSLKEAYEYVSAANDPVKKGKQTLVLSNNRGAFIKACPGTREYRCCGYKILHIASFCNMDCAYCILQTYFHPPVLQFFVNHDKLLRELDQVFTQNLISRVGTGEFTDSLIWERYTNLTQVLVEKFSEQTRAVLELKTKTVAVETLNKLIHNRKTIMSWSLNTEKIIGSEECFTATLSARLKAAGRCESWGYPVAFHFDPIVIYNGCEADYEAVIKQIFSHVSAENIVWISLGTFRYMPALKAIIQDRFEDSRIVYGEFIPGLDGKMRYFKPLRIRLYRKMVAWIRESAPDVCIYFCMEDDDVWQKTLGFPPSEKGGLEKMLDMAAIQHCGLAPRKTGNSK